MMKTKRFSAFLAATAAVLVVTTAFSSLLTVGAADDAAAERASAAAESIQGKSDNGDYLRYTNADTGYSVMILDEDNLLSDSEEASLTEEMQPLTQYGCVAFWTTAEYAADEIDQARRKRLELFGYQSAAIFAVNMRIRKLTIQTYGSMEGAVNASKARSITDNVKHYASSKEYARAAAEAYRQMLTVIEGGIIPEPMKYASYAALALMAGIILALAFAFSKRQNPLIEETGQFRQEEAQSVCQSVTVQHLSTDREMGRVPKVLWGLLKSVGFFAKLGIGSGGSGGGSSGGSSGGGGFSGGGFSGGGGGGCGSGGSSSF